MCVNKFIYQNVTQTQKIAGQKSSLLKSHCSYGLKPEEPGLLTKAL